MRGKNFWIKLALGAIFIWLVAGWLAPYFSGAKVVHPIWLTLGRLELHWYGLLMSIAVLLGFFIVLRLNQHFAKLDPDAIFYTLAATVFGGFVGARLLFIILEWPTYSQQLSEIWQTHHGGMSIHGAIIGGAVTLWLSTRYFFKINGWRVADLIAIALPIGQAIGRFGNFFNQEAFGGPTNLPWKMFVAPAFRPAGMTQFSFFHPAFLYEAVGDLLIAGLLWWALTTKYPKAGIIAFWYLILYSSWRFVVEWWRIDSVHLGGLTLAQWGCLIIIAIAIWLINIRRKYAD